MMPDGLVFGLIVLAGGGAALSLHATTARQERLVVSALYLVAGLVILVGAVGLASWVTK